MQANQISSSYFDRHSGIMLLSTSKVFRWDLKEDTQTRIIIEQQHAVARDFLIQYKEGLKRCNILKESEQTKAQTEGGSSPDSVSEFAVQRKKKQRSDTVDLAKMLANR